MTDTEDKKLCFVITPIGDNNSDIRRHIDGIIDQAIVPALGEKYDIVVAHRKYEIGSINDRVVRSVFEADLVIANLTNTNPNVMYELAIRYSFGKPAIVIAEEKTKLPFDVIDESTIFYINDPAGACDLKNTIIEYEKGIDFERKNYGPVHKIIGKIPLYNEVESGDDVSVEVLLQYMIDRLDSLDKNQNTKKKNKLGETSEKQVVLQIKEKLSDDSKNNADLEQELTILFINDEPFVDEEFYEILAVIKIYAIKEPEFDRDEDRIIVSFTILSPVFIDLINALEAWRASKDGAQYNIMYNSLIENFENLEKIEGVEHIDEYL